MGINKLVSVIIPTYGGGEFLNRAIDSVLKQTYRPLEIIVVDDNGIGTENQKNTASKMLKYKKCNNVYYICHEKNINGSAARNTGANNAHGYYLSLLDDDDIFLPEKIEKQVHMIESLPDEYGMIYCSNEMYRNEKKISERHVTESGSILYKVLMHYAVIGSSSILLKRQVWEQLGGFDESFRRHQDWEFTARVAANYKIYAMDYIGFRRYLEERNNPPSVELAKQYRLHYLNKMMPLIGQFNKSEQRNIIVSNRMDIVIEYVKAHDIVGFIKEYREIKPGIRGINTIIRRIIIVIKRGKLKL